MNLLGTGWKYCKRYTLPESTKVKIRNSKFELVVGKFISLYYLLNAFLRKVFLILRKSLSVLIEVMIVQFYSTLQLPSYTLWLYRSVSMKIPDQNWIWSVHLCKLPFRFYEIWSYVNYEVLSAYYVTHSKKFSIPLDAG